VSSALANRCLSQVFSQSRLMSTQLEHDPRRTYEPAEYRRCSFRLRLGIGPTSGRGRASMPDYCGSSVANLLSPSCVPPDLGSILLCQLLFELGVEVCWRWSWNLSFQCRRYPSRYNRPKLQTSRHGPPINTVTPTPIPHSSTTGNPADSNARCAALPATVINAHTVLPA
jgi:hypothetical protein